MSDELQTRPDSSPTEQEPEPAPAAAQENATSTGVDGSDESGVPLSRSQQLLVVLVMSTLVLLLGLHWARLNGWGLEPVEIERLESQRYEYQLEINSATWVEWIQLPGIGKPTAEKIILDREQNGPFQSIDDLTRVNGIGEKKLEAMRPWLRIESE